MPSITGSGGSILKRAANWLRGRSGSKRSTESALPNTVGSWISKAAYAASAGNRQSRADHLLSITYTISGNRGSLEVFSASFVTSESSVLEALGFLLQQPNTSLTHLQFPPLDAKFWLPDDRNERDGERNDD